MKLNFENLKIMVLGFATPPALKAIVAAQAQHQEDVIKVRCVLPGKYTYEQVETAINASGTHPNEVYYDLATDKHTPALARFYEALNGAKKEAGNNG